MLSALIAPITSIIDKLIPDPKAKAEAQLELLRMTQSGELKEVELSLSAIVAEANSSDPWTSRARPSFLYVIYLMILMSIPMGFLFAFKPEVAQAVTDGVNAWLMAIPEPLYTLFGIGYLGYTGARTWDKSRGKLGGSK